MENEKVYKRLIKNFNSMSRCKDSIKKGAEQHHVDNWNYWIDKYEGEIDKIMTEYLPHGPGIDNGVTFDYDRSKENKLVFNSFYHAMDENGYYDKWIEFTVTITPSLELDYDMRIVGNFGKYSHVKDYLYELFDYCINKEYIRGDV